MTAYKHHLFNNTNMLSYSSSHLSFLTNIQVPSIIRRQFPSTPAIIHFLGWDDARLYPADWSLINNPFWTSFLFSLVAFPCLFYGTWYLNPSLSKNRLGLSWVLGFYSALFFTIAGFYEVPHLRTVFNAAVDYQPTVLSIKHVETMFSRSGGTQGTITTSSVTVLGANADLSLGLTAVAGAIAMTTGICYPILKSGTLALLPTLPSFMRMDPSTAAKYYCFSDFLTTTTPYNAKSTEAAEIGRNGIRRFKPLEPYISDKSGIFFRMQKQQRQHHHEYNPLVQYGHPIPPHHDISHFKKNIANKDRSSTPHRNQQQSQDLHHKEQKHVQAPSLRHRVYQGQMQRPHLLFSLENYPDDARIGPHIIAANFQAFLIVDLIIGGIYYRKQLEPFSTVIHHIIYYFIVVHMRAGDMLSVFCILGTPIEASSIFLAYGRMFPHLRSPIVERLYLTCFITTRLFYVSLLWHEVYYNYPDKSVAFLYTITLSLHVYWFVRYIQTQRRFADKKRQQQLCNVLQSLANALKEDFVSSAVESAGISSAAVTLEGKMAHVRGDDRGIEGQREDKDRDPLLESLLSSSERWKEEDLMLLQPYSNVYCRCHHRGSPQL